MSFAFNDFFHQRHRADWVQISLAVTNFDAVRRPLKAKVRLFQAAGWNRHPKEILSVDYTLRRRISTVRFDNLPIGIPLYIHVSGDVALADADEHGLVSGVEQFLGQRAQVRLVARVAEPRRPIDPAQQQAPAQAQARAQAQQAAQARAQAQRAAQRPEWATGPRRFQKMHSLASRQSLVKLGEYEGAVTSLEARAGSTLQVLNRHLAGELKADLPKVKAALYDIDDELEALRSSKLDAVHLRGLQSGAQLATDKKTQLVARAAALSRRLRQALANPVLPPDTDSEDDAPSLKEDEGDRADGSGEDDEGAVVEEEDQDPGVSSGAIKVPQQEPFAPKATLHKPTAPETATEAGGAAGGGDPAVIAPAPFGRQYSVASQQRMVRLADIRERVDVIASEYAGNLELLETLDASTQEGALAMGKVKTECALLFGNLEKLQFKEIDGVLVGDLTSGQEDARTARKQLTRDVSDLSDKVKGTVLQLKEKLAAAPLPAVASE